MSESITFHLVSPEKKLASTEANTVCIPGMEGNITILPSHADFVTTLRPGIIQIQSQSDEQEYVVTGGFVEISGTVTTVLAEKAISKAEANAEFFEPFITEAEEKSEKAEGKEKSRVDLRLNDLRGMAQLLK